MSAVLSSALLLSACGSSSTQAPAATVGETDITSAQVAHEASLFSFLSALNQQPCGTKVGGETQDAACNRFALSNLIQEHFVQNFATANKVSVTDQDVTTIIGNLDKQIGADKVDAALKAQHLGRADLEQLARSVLLFQKVPPLVVTDQDLTDAIKANPADNTTVDVDHILVQTKADAEKVYQQVTKPGSTEKDFIALAKKVSIDPGAAQNSGALGPQVASTYLPEFAAAALALKPGQISQPVQTTDGWHVILLKSKQLMSLDQAKQTLLPTLFNDWLTKQATDQGVHVNPGFGKYDLSTLTVVPINSTDPSASSSPSTAVSPASPTP